jgi:hypothetical protein
MINDKPITPHIARERIRKALIETEDSGALTEEQVLKFVLNYYGYSDNVAYSILDKIYKAAI